MIKNKGQDTISAADYLAIKSKPAPGNKFKAEPVTTGGVKYDSTKEGKYSHTLDYRKRLPPGTPDRVLFYRRQVRFDFYINGILITYYKLDFLVYYEDGRIEFIDVKGLKKGSVWRTFVIKQNLMLAVYGIRVETR